jgi:hypothetical protein
MCFAEAFFVSDKRLPPLLAEFVNAVVLNLADDRLKFSVSDVRPGNRVPISGPLGGPLPRISSRPAPSLHP